MKRACVCAAFVILAACSSGPAPVDERSDWTPAGSHRPEAGHVVESGDSLYTIGFRYDLDYRDLAAWNGIRSPYVINPGQVIRLSPPEGYSARATAGVTTTGARTPSSSTVAASVDPAPTPRAQTRPAPEPAETTPPTSEPQVTAAPPPSASVTDPDAFLWPTDGRITSSFKAGDSSRNGIEISGNEGQPIRATAGGVVVYSGNGLIGYGELIIIKHSDRLLSAYAHNRVRNVAEGESVDAGETIAEMGRNGRNQAVLHFEIRANGRPDNPLNYLPSR